MAEGEEDAAADEVSKYPRDNELTDEQRTIFETLESLKFCICNNVNVTDSDFKALHAR